MWGKTLSAATPAAQHNRFISAQICTRERRFPPPVRNTSPEVIFCRFAYFKSFLHSFSGSRIVRTLPFRATTAFPRRRASTVIYGTSPTRMPVAQIVSITSASRSLPSVLAVRTSVRYSSRSSSRSASRKLRRWSRSAFTLHSGQPIKAKKRLIPASMALTVAGAYWAVSCAFHVRTRPRSTIPPLHRAKARTARR